MEAGAPQEKEVEEDKSSVGVHEAPARETLQRGVPRQETELLRHMITCIIYLGVVASFTFVSAHPGCGLGYIC